ncbi:MAG TPA: PKD domain-containing protein [Candidatus Thermoplasmatota archaeon]
MTLSPGEAETNAFSKYVPDQPGEQSASITIQGTVAGEPNSSCTPILRPFRIDPAPEPLRATILANRLGGDPPLTIDLESLVTGGTPPLEISWTFADGQTAEGANVTHTFSTAADHIVQLVVRDAAGRVATDRVTVAVSEPDPSPLRGETGLALAGWVVAGAVGAALVLLFQAIRFRGPSPPAQSAHDLEDNRLTPAAPEEQVAPPESPSLAARLKSAGASSGDEPGQSATGPEADDERKSVQ